MPADEFETVEDLLEEDVSDEMDMDGDTERPSAPQPMVWNPDSPNLVPDLLEAEGGEEKLKELEQMVYEYFDEAWRSSEQHREQETNNWKLFAGDLPAKEYPFHNCANMHIPMTLENISRLSLRAHGEIFGDGRDVFTVEPVGPDDVNTAEIMSVHDNWQITEKIPDFSRQMHRAILAFFFHGDVVSESYWSEELQQNRHEVLSKDEFVAPYVHLSTMPDLSDLPYYFRVRRMYRNELQALRNQWFGVDEVLDKLPQDTDNDPDSPMAAAAAETAGIDAPLIQQPYSGTYSILQFEGWLSLDPKDRDRWCKVFMHHESKRILLLRIHEEPPWEERARFEAQQQELQNYKAAMEQYSTALSELESMKMQAESGVMPPEASIALQNQVANIGPPPIPPSWADPNSPDPKPDPMERAPIRMFRHAVCIENLTGMLGLSYGRIQADLNRVANTAMNQFIDAGTLANNWVMLMPGGVDLERPTNFEPGAQIKVVGTIGSDLSKSILPLKPDPANPQLREVVELAYRFSSSSIQANAILSGEPGKSGETYRGLSARLEQAQKQLSVSTASFAEQMVKGILINNARLNSIFMPEDEIYYLMNHRRGELQNLRVGRGMYRRRYSIRFRADLRFSTTAMKIGEADELLQMPRVVREQLGPMAGPQADMSAFTYDAIVASLKARNRPDLIPALGPRPQNPPVPMGFVPPPPVGAPPGPPPERGPE